jgi:hypothetical protein
MKRVLGLWILGCLIVAGVLGVFFGTTQAVLLILRSEYSQEIGRVGLFLLAGGVVGMFCHLATETEDT